MRVASDANERPLSRLELVPLTSFCWIKSLDLCPSLLIVNKKRISISIKNKLKKVKKHQKVA